MPENTNQANVNTDQSSVSTNTDELENLVQMYQKRIDLVHFVLNNMASSGEKRILLGGETGIGKTSFVEQLAQILGFKTIVIEIPQAIEEELINIPFIVKSESGGTAGSGASIFQIAKTMDVKLAKSNLVSKLNSLQKIPDNQYASYISRLPKNMQNLIRAYEFRYPGEIQNARARYENILFLDEFLRYTTPTIRNIMRGMLNGKLGMDPLPSTTYIIYATNLFDEGIEKAGAHATHFQKKFSAPTVEEWLSYITSITAISWNPDVLNIFKKYLTDEVISYTFPTESGDVRTSPRRWTEIILAINNFYPFKDLDTVGLLYGTIKRQFTEGSDNTSPVLNVINSIIGELAQKCGFNLSTVKQISGKDWQDVLSFQVMLKMTVGKSKKYVPVLQGLPGIGKTSIARKVAKDNNLLYISIECPTLEPDHVVGIPLLGKQTDVTGKNAEDVVEFAEPLLYKLIMRDIERAEKNYYEDLVRRYGDAEAKIRYDNFQSQDYKYLILFDEINRVRSVNVFNALRRVILEKTFNAEYSLPEGSVVIGAMNPTDDLSIPLTGHFKDAIEMIDVDPDWELFTRFLDTSATESAIRKGADKESIELAAILIKEFPEVFSRKTTGKKDNEFYIDVGAAEIYINPRDYDHIFLNIAQALTTEFKSITNRINRGVKLGEKEVRNLLTDAVYPWFESSIENSAYNQDIDPGRRFYDKLRKYVSNIIDQGLRQTGKIPSLDTILDFSFSKNLALDENQDFINYMKAFERTKFSQEFTKFLYENLKKNKNPLDYLFGPDYNIDEAMPIKVARSMISAIENNNFSPDARDCIRKESLDLYQDFSSKDFTKLPIEEQYQIGKYLSRVINTILRI